MFANDNCIHYNDDDMDTIQYKSYILYIIIFLVAFCVYVEFLVSPVFAFSTAVGYLYKDNSIVSGNLVSVNSQNGSQYIEKANLSNNRQVLGVVDNSSFLTQSNGTGNVDYVSSSGTVLTYVSTVNGNITSGDYICPSPINGVGMYCESGYTVGRALDNFNSSSKNASSYSVNSVNGGKTTVYVGEISVDINVQYISSANSSGPINSILTAIGVPISGKPISLAQLIVVFIIIMTSIIFAGIIIFRSAKNSTISIGRNPLAKSDILRGFYSIATVGVLLVFVAFIVSFLVIKGWI